MKSSSISQLFFQLLWAVLLFGACLLSGATINATEPPTSVIDLYSDSSRFITLDSAPALQKPTVALFKSLVLPGWGQLGNHRNLKAGFVIALEGALVYRWLDLRGETADLRKKYESLPIGSPERGAAVDHFVATRYDRNLFGWLTGATIFLSMFDAYVDAHLARFPSRKKEQTITQPSVSITPQIGAESTLESVIGVRLKVTF